MPASTTGKTGNLIPQAETGKTKAVPQPEPRATSGNKSRKARVKEDVDPDYAEEAEDFFYGEGM